MKTYWTRTVGLAVLAAGTMLAATSQAKLTVGDPAPKLQTGKWIQGEPVAKFENGKAYIVEFWATWCGPCRASIPHLNEVYTKYKDKGLVAIGVDCWERDESLVAPFVKKMGDQMTYRVVLDDKTENKEGKMAETWMAAAGRNGIPSAFLVDTHGMIAWIGHPMALPEKVLEQVLADKYDIRKAAAAFEQEQKSETQMRAAWMEINNAMRQKKWDTALSKLDELEKGAPEDQRDSFEGVRFNILLGKEDYPAAYKVAAGISEAHKDNAMLQNQLAWQIATDPKIKQRDLDLADTIAKRANDAAQGKDANILDTVARIAFMQGRKTEAISVQEKAIQLAEGDQKAGFQKTLEGYQRGELSKAE